METAATFCYALVNFLAQSAPYIIVGYLIAAVIKEFVPLQVFVRYFGGKGLRPLLRAVGVGALLPICSCGVIPVGIGAFRGGAARGTTLAFITSGPSISPVAVLLSLTLLGPKLALCFALSALGGALLIGTVGNRLLSGTEEERLRASRAVHGAAKELPESANRTFPGKLRGAAKWAFWDLGTDISVDLLLGLCIAAGLLAVLPDVWIATWLGEQRFTTLLYVIAVGVPLYTCTVPAIPVVHSLLLLGMSPGAAVAYLISGPATNLGEVNVLRRKLGGATAALFVAGLVTVSLAGGLLTDYVMFPDYKYAASFVGNERVVTSCCVAPVFGQANRADKLHSALSTVPAWHYPFMVVLGAALTIGIARRATGAWNRFGKRRGERAAVAGRTTTGSVTSADTAQSAESVS